MSTLVSRGQRDDHTSGRYTDFGVNVLGVGERMASQSQSHKPMITIMTTRTGMDMGMGTLMSMVLDVVTTRVILVISVHVITFLQYSMITSIQSVMHYSIQQSNSA
jgi:hypothetical protein